MITQWVEAESCSLIVFSLPLGGQDITDGNLCETQTSMVVVITGKDGHTHMVRSLMHYCTLPSMMADCYRRRCLQISGTPNCLSVSDILPYFC